MPDQFFGWIIVVLFTAAIFGFLALAWVAESTM